MNLNQILNALNSAAMSPTMAADGKRVLRDEANTLRAHAQRQSQVEAQEKAWAKLRGDESNQAQAQRVSIQRELDRIGPVNLAAAIAEAQRTLKMWTE